MNNNINILFIGDIIGQCGLELTTRLLKSFKDKYKIDFTIANGENVTDGKSISEQDANTLFNAGIDVLTGGNHTWDRFQIKALLCKEKRILRPLNYPKENVGFGYFISEPVAHHKIGVINLQGRTFMQAIDCPFKAADWAIAKIKEETKIIIIDMHAEASAEKLAMGWYLDGQVSAVIGTHTHIPTADERILPNGTGYITDAGMTGPFDSVVGMKKDIAIKRFVRQTPFKYEPATDDARICGLVLKIDAENGKCLRIERIVFPEFQKGQN
jgi:2',3'-cyclic-nucleotide 2'-phosphodiesterase